jgi:hypothetical protein
MLTIRRNRFVLRSHGFPNISAHIVRIIDELRAFSSSFLGVGNMFFVVGAMLVSNRTTLFFLRSMVHSLTVECRKF